MVDLVQYVWCYSIYELPIFTVSSLDIQHYKPNKNSYVTVKFILYLYLRSKLNLIFTFLEWNFLSNTILNPNRHKLGKESKALHDSSFHSKCQDPYG